VESSPDVGSTFTRFLPQRYIGAEAGKPLKTQEIETNAAVPRLPAHADFTDRKILLVDDDIRNIFAINSVLEARKMTVLHAENGKICIILFIDLVLTQRSLDLSIYRVIPGLLGVSARLYGLIWEETDSEGPHV